jgi:hypothetical protein
VRRLFQVALLALSLLTMLFMAPLAQAQGSNVGVAALQVERAEDGVFLSASVDFDLPAVIEDALTKGVAMYFVAEAEVQRNRWYWYDKTVATASRHMRLAYQPLTRRWRLNVSSGPITQVGLGVTLNQNFDSLPEAMSVIQRISRWKIAEESDLDADVSHKIEFRFRLDVSQLPRPFQIGVVGQADWNLSASRRLVLEPAR